MCYSNPWRNIRRAKTQDLGDLAAFSFGNLPPMHDAASAAQVPIRIALADPNDDAGILASVALGNLARATLGLLPIAAYREAATKGTLVLARRDDSVIAYALFGLAAHHVRLTHVCVHPAHRRQGVARALVKWISARHREYPGISARCRHDYGLGEMWIGLGFAQEWEAPGRSKAGHLVVNWWRDHGHANLFTRAPDTVTVRASIDLNILRDLADDNRPDALESLALIGDDITDRLQLVRTAALASEIDAIEGTLRGRCIRRAQALPAAVAKDDAVHAVSAALVAVARQAWPQYPTTPQDELDIRHVADSVASGLNVFVTRDRHLTEVLGGAAEELYGLRVLRPVDVLVHIDELARAEAYRPAALLDTTFKRQLIGVGHDKALQTLVNRPAHEKPTDLERLLRELARTGYERVGVFAPDGAAVGAYATSTRSGVLDVPLLRVAEHAGADTVARQLLFLLRQQSRDAKTSVLRITDRHPSQAVILAAIGDGFLHHDASYCAYVLDVASTAADVEHAAVAAARLVSLPAPAPMKAGMPEVVAAEIERRWWPAKVIDSQLPTFLIPIQQRYSVDLLGVPAGLFPRDAGLGLSREHVYYRSPLGAQIGGPARLLWYMSGSGVGPHPPGVIACSQLDEVIAGSAEELHSRFRHLGVWSMERISESTRDGVVQALRFSNTEVFARPVGLQRLRDLGKVHGEHALPQGPLRISTPLFADLYAEGRSRG